MRVVAHGADAGLRLDYPQQTTHLRRPQQRWDILPRRRPGRPYRRRILLKLKPNSSCAARVRRGKRWGPDWGQPRRIALGLSSRREKSAEWGSLVRRRNRNQRRQWFGWCGRECPLGKRG